MPKSLKRDTNLSNFGIYAIYLTDSLNIVVSASYSVKDNFTLEAAKILYYSMAQSLLTYAIAVWGNTSANTLNQ